MEGLTKIGTIPARYIREEYKLIIDKPTYDVVRRFASVADMQEIDGWARSFYTRQGHLDSIDMYRKPLISEPCDPIWNNVKIETMMKIKEAVPTVTSLSFESDFDFVPFESSSAAGYGYDGKKGEGNNFNRAKTIANAAVRTFEDQLKKEGYNKAVDFLVENGTPDVAFTRTQLARLPSIKVRNVFGEAFHYILIEGLSAAPLLAAFKSRTTFYVTGKDPTEYVPRLLFDMGLNAGWFVCLDWKSFDATVQLWEIDHAFNCLEQLIKFPTKLSQLAFYYAKESFKVRKLASPNGDLLLRRGGIPSGSYFTNLVGSIINYTRIHYIFRKNRLNIQQCYVQGDDSVIYTDSFRPNPYDLAEAGEQFGWILNSPKCTVTDRSEEVTFLGRSQQHQFNIRERLKILRLMCFPEYEVEDPSISVVRVRMIARDAGFHDYLYNDILYSMKSMYPEAAYVPQHLLTYFDRFDFQDVNM